MVEDEHDRNKIEPLHQLNERIFPENMEAASLPIKQPVTLGNVLGSDVSKSRGMISLTGFISHFPGFHKACVSHSRIGMLL